MVYYEAKHTQLALFYDGESARALDIRYIVVAVD